MATTDEIKAWAFSDFVQVHVRRAVEFGRDEWTEGILHTLEHNICLDAFESPLEMAFVMWWLVLSQLRSFTDMRLVLQVKALVAGGQSFRVDFEVAPSDLPAPNVVARLGLQTPRVAIELDGHEFHERTKEQVIARDTRDRALQVAGWHVFHVSGAAFHRNPEETVWQTYLDANVVFWRFKRQVNTASVTP